jgi:hypothetical protein
LREVLFGFIVKCEEGLFFLTNEHQAVVIITFNISSQLDVGNQEIVVLVLRRMKIYLLFLGLEPELGSSLSHWHN